MGKLPQIIGFIGGGQMALAIAKGLSLSGLFEKNNLLISGRSNATKNRVLDAGFQFTSCNLSLIRACKESFVFICVEPRNVSELLDELIKDPGTFQVAAFISVCAATPLSKFFTLFPVPIVRIMPNILCSTLNGVASVCFQDMKLHCSVVKDVDDMALDEPYNVVLKVLMSCMKVYIIPEELFAGAAALSGSGPAYIFYFVNALIDAGVKSGLPRDVSTDMAIQTVLGSSLLMKEACPKYHPSQLQDRVTTPGGTTIRGISALDKGCLRYTVIDAIDTTVAAAKTLEEKNSPSANS